MDALFTFVVSALGAGGAFLMAIVAVRQGWLDLAGDVSEGSNARRIIELERELTRERELRKQNARRIIELERELTRERELRKQLEERVDFLVGELQRAGVKISDLEQRLSATAATVSRETASDGLAKPLLLICGPDAAMCNSDRRAIRKAGISFQRVYDAGKVAITAELRRRRQSDSLYRWIHVTAHATPAGIMLGDGLAEPEWWHEQLDGIEVVFLAACTTTAVADALAGLVTVIFVHEDIENRDASDFTYAFWRRMAEHGDPVQAYRQAIMEAPQVAEFTDIRTS